MFLLVSLNVYYHIIIIAHPVVLRHMDMRFVAIVASSFGAIKSADFIRR